MAKPVRLNARAIKVSLVLDSDQVAAIAVDDAPPRVPIAITVDGRLLDLEIAAKSLRKAQRFIAEAGPDGAVLVLQGKLAAGDVIVEAGLVVQPRVSKHLRAAEMGDVPARAA